MKVSRLIFTALFVFSSSMSNAIISVPLRLTFLIGLPGLGPYLWNKGGVMAFGPTFVGAPRTKCDNPYLQNTHLCKDTPITQATLQPSILDSIESGIMAGVGIILMDKEGTETAQLPELTDEQAATYGIVGEELSAYRSELTKLNLVFESVIGTLQQQIANKALTEDEQIAAADKIWQNAIASGSISQQAFNAATKVTAKALEVRKQ